MSSPTPLEAREDAYRDAIRAGRWRMLLVLAACAAPVIASYVTFYIVKPQGRMNYGELIDPARPVTDAPLKHLDGRPARLSDYRGKWLLVAIDAGACETACADKLFKTRQLRTMQGKDRERVERVWLITDDTPLSTMLMREHDDLRMLRARGTPLVGEMAGGGDATAGIWLIDPLGNLVLRYPRDADPKKMHRDIGRLLKYSRIG
jgi:cytochrome oxidase Cu insertion factor (SCO1/SenC/PrrC family)